MQGVLPLAVTYQLSQLSSSIYHAKLSLYPVQNFPKDFFAISINFTVVWIHDEPYLPKKPLLASVYTKFHLISAGGTRKRASGQLLSGQFFPFLKKRNLVAHLPQLVKKTKMQPNASCSVLTTATIQGTVTIREPRRASNS